MSNFCSKTSKSIFRLIGVTREVKKSPSDQQNEFSLTESNKSKLEDCAVVQVDGTFSYKPRRCEQKCCDLEQRKTDNYQKPKEYKMTETELRWYTVRHPHRIVWNPCTKTVLIKKGAHKTFGVKLKDSVSPSRNPTMDGDDHVIYLIVKYVWEDSPAHGKLAHGDLVRSINNRAVQNAKDVELLKSDLVNAGPEDEIKLVIQSPQRRVSDHRPQCSRHLKKEFHKLGLEKMPKLPDVQILFLGDDNKEVAKTLINSDIFQMKQTSEFYTKGAFCVSKVRDSPNKETADFKVYACDESFEDWIKRGSVFRGQNEEVDSGYVQGDDTYQFVQEDATDPNRSVYVSVLAPNHSSHSIAYEHLFICPFTVFVLSLRYSRLTLGNHHDAVRELVERLRRIRLYAGKAIRIILAITFDQDISSVDQKEAVSKVKAKVLHNFQSQLEFFHGENPCCFVKVEGVEDTGMMGRKEGEFPSLGYTTLSQGVSRNQEVTSRLLEIAFEQNFIKAKYPFNFLSYRTKIWKLKRQRAMCDFPANIQRACGINENEFAHFLRYIHSTGDVIAFGPDKSTSCVLLHPDSLIDPVIRLLHIPSKEDQAPELRHHWDILERTNMISKVLLQDCLLSSSERLEFLERLNVIYPLEKNNCATNFAVQKLSTAQQMILNSCNFYLLPPRFINVRHEELGIKLFVHFPGWIPHGSFARFVIQMVECGKGWNLDWTMTSAHQCKINLGCHGTIILEEQLTEHEFRISARIREDYCQKNLLCLVEEAMARLETYLPDKEVPVIGVKCPLHQETPHIIPVYSKHCSHVLLCGIKRVQNHPVICQWHPHPDEMSQIMAPAITKEQFQKSQQTLITDLPTSVYHMMCMKLSVPCRIGIRDWRGVAGYLGKTADQVENIDTYCKHVGKLPCDLLFREWCQVSRDATIGKLMEILADMKRQDVLSEIKKLCIFTE